MQTAALKGRHILAMGNARRYENNDQQTQYSTPTDYFLYLFPGIAL
jgi:hypothetical protein